MERILVAIEFDRGEKGAPYVNEEESKHRDNGATGKTAQVRVMVLVRRRSGRLFHVGLDFFSFQCGGFGNGAHRSTSLVAATACGAAPVTPSAAFTCAFSAIWSARTR